MKMFLYSLLLLAGLAGAASAQTNLAGTWQGRLEPEPGKSLTIQFVITAKPDGTYTAVVTSPDDGAIKNVPAKSVTFTGDKLSIDVPALSGSYAGTLRKGALDGEWSQAGARLPLSLRPWQAHTLSKADIDALRGDWSGKLTGGIGTVTIVLHFTTGADGALKSTFDVPEQGAKDWEVKNVALEDGYFSAELPRGMAKITGSLKADQIAGQWNQLGKSTPLTLRKGKYVAAQTYLDLPAAARDQVKGHWSGSLNGLTLRVRFETDAQGRTLGFLDSPQQNSLGIPITSASMTGTRLTYAVSGIGGSYTGELAGDKLTGEWSQFGLPKPLPLEFTRDK
jgi:hypothetical protein